MSDYERTITFNAAWDKRSDIPSQNYGIHGVTIRFVLKGPAGATQFVLYTNWQLPEVTKELARRPPYEARGGDPHWMERPIPVDLGYHALTPQYEGHTPMGSCDLFPELPNGCYYAGSSLAAEGVYDILLREGSEGVWKRLEEEYRKRFETVEAGV